MTQKGKVIHSLITINRINNTVNNPDAAVDRWIDPYLLEAHSTLPEANHNQTAIMTLASHRSTQGEAAKSPKQTSKHRTSSRRTTKRKRLQNGVVRTGQSQQRLPLSLPLPAKHKYLHLHQCQYHHLRLQ
jgi:hypothetical protein